MDRKQAKAIRMRILHLLDVDPNNPEIQQLSKLLKKDKVEKVVERGSKRKQIDPEKFIELRNKHFSMNEVAEYFECSVSTLKSDVNKLKAKGLIDKGTIKPGRQQIKLTEDEYLKFKEDGLSDLAISKIIGVHPTSIKNFKKRWSIPDLRDTKKKLTKEEYLLKKQQGLSDEKIAKEHGIARYSISRNRKLWGVTKKSYETKLITLEEYREMKAQLIPDYVIAKNLGFARDTLIEYKKRWGIHKCRTSKTL